MDDEAPGEPSGPRWTGRLIWLAIGVIVLLTAYFTFSYYYGPAVPQSNPTPEHPTTAPVTPAPKPSLQEPHAEAPAPRPRLRPRPAPARPAHPAAPAPAAPTETMLTVNSDVDGALVFLDRRYLGKTPLPPQTVTPGSHALNVSAEGYDPYGRTVNLEPGAQTIDVRFKVVRLDETLAVKHKHAFGSCSGTLVATVDGLKYETTHTSDAFSVPLADLEVFKVDYLKNNLEIRLRGGRTFNFTEQKGGADALFVFHRDVQHAIDQLKKQAAAPQPR